MAQYKIRQLHEADRFVVSHLRREIMWPTQTSNGPIEHLNWGPSDRNAYVYGVFNDELLISTLRLEVLNDQITFENRFDLAYDKLPIEFPIGLTSRAATHAKFRKMGWNLVLKLICYCKAMDLGITIVAASMKTSALFTAQHTLAFEKLGFHIRKFKNTNIAQLNLKQYGYQLISDIKIKVLFSKYKFEISNELLASSPHLNQLQLDLTLSDSVTSGVD